VRLDRDLYEEEKYKLQIELLKFQYERLMRTGEQRHIGRGQQSGPSRSIGHEPGSTAR
jgi:hypothetical protein